jgi:hypothetical protein
MANIYTDLPALKYVIKQLKTVTGTDPNATYTSQILHPETDAFIVRFLDTAGLYGTAGTTTNVGDILASGVINPSSTAQIKEGNLTVNGVTLGKVGSETLPSVSFKGESTYSKIVKYGAGTLSDNVTFNLPAKTTGTFTLATTDDIPEIDVENGIFELDYTEGTLSFAAYASKPGNIQSFYLGTDNPTVTTRLNLDASLHATGFATPGSISVGGNSSVTGNSTVTGLSNLNGGIAVDTNKFTVDAGGNTAVAGTLGVTGNTTLTGMLYANGGINVNSGKFTVDSALGNTVTTGTLTVSGDNLTSLGGDLTVSGAATVAETLTVSGIAQFREDLSVGIYTLGNDTFISKFAVDQATGDLITSGNAAFGGSLTVTGGNIFCQNTDGSGTFNIGSANLSPTNATLNLGSQPIVNPANSAYIAKRTINIGGNGALGTDTTVNIGSPLEDPNHSIINLYGTVNVIGGTGSVITTETLNVTDNEIVLNANVETTVFNGTSGIVINRGWTGINPAYPGDGLPNPTNIPKYLEADKRIDATLYWNETSGTWEASSGLIVQGNTISQGTLTSQGNFAVGASGTPNLFTVNASTGAVQANGAVTVAGLASLNGGIAVDGNMFTVADESGNTVIQGTLLANNTTTIGGNLSVTGNYSTTLSGSLTANGATTLNNTLSVVGNYATNLGGDLTVDGKAYVENDFAVVNTSNIADIKNAFFVQGNSGNTIVYGTLDVEGSALFNGDVVIEGGAGIDFIISNGSTTKFSVDSTNGNVIGGRYNDLGITGGYQSSLNIGMNGAISLTEGSSLSTSGKDIDVLFSAKKISVSDFDGSITTVRDINLNGNLTIGNETNTGNISITSNSTADRIITLESSVTVRGLNSGYVLYAPDNNTIASEEHLSVTRGGTGIGSYTTGDILYANGSSELSRLPIGNSGEVLVVSGGKPTWGSGGLPDSGVNAGTYSVVTVNSKGIVTAGAQFIEVGANTSVTAPSVALAVGGLFFQEVAA